MCIFEKIWYNVVKRGSQRSVDKFGIILYLKGAKYLLTIISYYLKEI